MIRFCVILWLLLGGAALAAPVQVSSGEHDGFTRLVIDFGGVVDWKVGRSDDGYDLRVDTPESLRFDLTRAFELIGTTRLAALWADPAGKGLHIGLACACHAIPFEFRPGIIVIDLKDGPPPKGSSFEEALDGGTVPPLSERTAPRPRPRPVEEPGIVPHYDWLAEAPPNLRQPAAPSAPALASPSEKAILPHDPDLAPLRDSLLRSLVEGAAQGRVDLTLDRAAPVEPGGKDPSSAQIRISEQPGLVSQPVDSREGDLAAEGEICLSPEILDVAAWGDDTLPVPQQLADNLSGLVGEFDKPHPDILAQAIRLYLFLGFGTEARQLMKAFPPETQDASVWLSLSYLVEGEVDPTGQLAPMAACEGPTALWAVLSDTERQGTAFANAAAVRLAFSALPSHLRQDLGPSVAQYFLSAGDQETARAIHDAMARATMGKGGNASLLAAEIALDRGDPAGAEAQVSALLDEPGPGQLPALIAYAEARAKQGFPVDPRVPASLSAFADAQGEEVVPGLTRALILAEAAAGRFDEAFNRLPMAPDAASDLWNLTLALAPDEPFLRVAVAEETPLPARVDAETRVGIARRLLSLGLPTEAARWLADGTSPPALLQAQIALARRDGKTALPLLSGLEGAEADALSLQALELTGQDRLRADRLIARGEADKASPALARSEDWTTLSRQESSPWSVLASKAVTVPARPEQDATPLAAGHALLAQSEETRTAIAELLSVLPVIQQPLPGAN